MGFCLCRCACRLPLLLNCFLPGERRTHAAPLNILCWRSVQCHAFLRCFKMKYYVVLWWLRFCDCRAKRRVNFIANAVHETNLPVHGHGRRCRHFYSFPTSPQSVELTSAKNKNLVRAWQRQIKRRRQKYDVEQNNICSSSRRHTHDCRDRFNKNADFDCAATTKNG